MLTLIEAYLQILRWTTLNFPESQNAFLPSLTLQEIKSISSRLTFDLPNDLQELYQLNNGQKFYPNMFWQGDLIATPEHENEELNIFDGKSFLPLQSAVARKCANFDSNWLILFTYEDEEYLVLNTSNGYLLYFDPSSHLEVSSTFAVYSSLTNMMRTHAEFYESGEDIEGVRRFSEAYQQVWLKYNAEIGEQAINTVLSHRGY
ncbi:SMI1/KNR4 family protein [Pseudanabaena sp. UWO310]|uniref:SMI1/KNR4 family protein n=1 Tax=Pseudanabaena sp. UWO310 TaxID=2480795 RepID=UPI00115B99BE|nr:SMI1/KNR4 family protein [Pseudanabaena sp. UWO310]TYQ30106.1 SMI1/KNR4 family protein [Pseudanabaena sp. UWO310]